MPIARSEPGSCAVAARSWKAISLPNALWPIPLGFGNTSPGILKSGTIAALAMRSGLTALQQNIDCIRGGLGS